MPLSLDQGFFFFFGHIQNWQKKKKFVKNTAVDFVTGTVWKCINPDRQDM